MWRKPRSRLSRLQLLEEWQHITALQLATDQHLAFRVDAVHLKDRLGDVETNGCDRLQDWLLRFVGASAAPTSLALPCRWRSRPQHHERTSRRIDRSNRHLGVNGSFRRERRTCNPVLLL